jgi:hypothetical protein
MSKIPAIGLRAASLTLPASLAAVVGTASTDAANATSGAIAIGSLQSARLVCQYARHASSTTGAPVFAVDLSMDPPSTAAASVANWVPIYILDGSVFAAGAIDAYPQAVAAKPTATGTTTRGTPPWDVRGAFWVRVRMADVDTTNMGAITLLRLGGEA